MKGHQERAMRFMIIILTVCLCEVSPAFAAEESIIRVKGANSMAAFVDSLAKSFKEKNPDATIIVSGGGTQVGIEALLDRTGEVAMAAVPFSDAQKAAAKEKGLELVEKLFGWGGVAVFVHPSNPVDELTRDQLRKLFNGEFNSWADVGGMDGPVKIYVGEQPISDSSVFFQSYVMKADPFKVGTAARRYDRYVVKAVAEDPQGIGVASLASFKRQRERYPVKPLGVARNENSSAVLPSDTTIQDRTYLLIRPLFLYWDGKAKDPMVQKFVNHCFVYGMSGRASGSK